MWNQLGHVCEKKASTIRKIKNKEHYETARGCSLSSVSLVHSSFQGPVQHVAVLVAGINRFSTMPPPYLLIHKIKCFWFQSSKYCTAHLSPSYLPSLPPSR